MLAGIGIEDTPRSSMGGTLGGSRSIRECEVKVQIETVVKKGDLSHPPIDRKG